MDSMISILQWNCQGLHAKFESLINEHSPACVSLQETMLGLKSFYPRDYILFHSDCDEERDDHGGRLCSLDEMYPIEKYPYKQIFKQLQSRCSPKKGIPFARYTCHQVMI